MPALGGGGGGGVRVVGSSNMGGMGVGVGWTRGGPSKHQVDEGARVGSE